MLSQKVKYFILVLMIGACSASQEGAQQILDQFPTPEIKEGANTLILQEVSEEVPSLKKNQKYYGVYPFEIEKEYELVINESGKSQVIDLEIKSSAERVFYFNSLAVVAFGECPKLKTTYTWYKMDSGNEVLSEESVDFMSYFSILANERAILRITHNDSTGCSFTSTQISFSEYK